ncbi:MAG: hypothetical protein ABUL44_04830 [Flavobacterium sp.]
MTDTVKFRQLLEYLDQAEKLVGEFKGGYSDHFFSSEEFHLSLKDSIQRLRNGEIDELNKLFLWFAPTYDWDDFTRSDGLDLGNTIFELLSNIIKSTKSKDIITLIKDYQQSIEGVMAAFKKKFNRTDLLRAYRSDKIFPRIGKLTEFGIKTYVFHGIGLAITFDDDKTVDFDFAFLPEQRHDGFDVWRLNEFVKSRPLTYNVYLDESKLKKDFEELIKSGLIVNPKLNHSTHLYFFTDSIKKENKRIPVNDIVESTKRRSWFQRIFDKL